MSAIGWALIGSGRLLSSPVGNQAYLSAIILFKQRVINKVAMEAGFPCTLGIRAKKFQRTRSLFFVVGS